MACPQPLFTLPFDMTLTSTDNQYRPLGSPVVLVGASGFDLVVIVDTVTGNARVTAAYQPITARPTVPDAVALATGGYVSTQTATKNTIDTSAVTDKYFAQLGIVGNLSAGTTPAYITGRVMATVSRCMSPISDRRLAVSGQSDNANANVYLLGRTPSPGADKLRAALIADGMKDMEYRFMVRGYLDPEKPSVFTNLGAGFTAFTDGNTATCLTSVSVSGVTPANYDTLEFAVALRMKSGGSAPAGFLRVISALSYT